MWKRYCLITVVKILLDVLDYCLYFCPRFELINNPKEKRKHLKVMKIQSELAIWWWSLIIKKYWHWYQSCILLEIRLISNLALLHTSRNSEILNLFTLKFQHHGQRTRFSLLCSLTRDCLSWWTCTNLAACTYRSLFHIYGHRLIIFIKKKNEIIYCCTVSRVPVPGLHHVTATV